MTRNPISKFGILAIVLLAPALGGATDPSCQALIVILIALLVGLFPPGRIDLPTAIAGTGLLGVSALSFLPNSWFALSSWRRAVTQSGISLPDTVTPQPWITLHAMVLLLAGLLWFAWITEQAWSAISRRVLARWFCLGAVVLAVVAIIAYFFDLNIPFWLKTERRFGPFPNRNQTSNFFAISTLVALALAHEAFHRKRQKWAAGPWFLAALVLASGLILSYSRAGIAIFFLGLLIWVLKFCRSLKKIALGLVFILVLLTCFFLFGGETLERFRSYTPGDFRFRIWRDALSMIGSSPWMGAGLGNFDSLFPRFRNISLQQQRILHPESDWLWLAAEAGLPAVLFVFCGFIATLRRALPFERKSARSLRAACAAGAIVFMVHGFVDVAAHRLGTVVPALFVLALALNPPRHKQPVLPVVPWAMRLLALILLVFGIRQIRQKPDEKQVASDFLHQRNYQAAIAHLNLSLQKTPLDWETYFLRGAAHASIQQWLEAVADFRRANLLEPVSQRLPVEEAKLWLRLNPPFALQACREAIRRCQLNEKGDVFSEILDASTSTPEILHSMGDMARGNTELELAFLRFADAQRVEEIVTRILPQVFRLPADRQKIIYFAAARLKAGQSDFESAYTLARQGIPSPILPKLGETSLEESQREFIKDPGNFAAAFVLYSAQMKEQRFQDALFTLEKVRREPKAPAYLQILAADLLAKLGHWDKAWEQLIPFLN